ncbi:4-hydroxy-tetrahydrodipicolinate reductase [Mesonia sp. K7]|uniref:4-hydroxy-tetrahydrodipicolinate reductase n=1 Tax=Mesonia sp. K7 TaxID=2218606 RepID=UPI000DA91AB9|nr:4-hydroxy-tetrahydrodipicolinate reductase [Mesonia sp. K7]PZD78281.1 4-hydroxy-tetrahydrodipicolinate reductase [Mesonia sp. K7]
MKIALLGYGRMGKAIEEIALERGHEVIYKTSENIRVNEFKEADVAIDFSIPDVAFSNISTCIEAGIPVISGTTGWLERYKDVVELCQKEKGTFLYASNFSLGVNLFFSLNEYLADLIQPYKEYQLELEEIHHTKKLDQPSGTAITLAENIIEKSAYNDWFLKNNETKSEKSIPIVAKRIENVPGTHVVSYNSEIDSIEIKHTAHNRKGFALGAVIAAEYVKDRQGIFTMKDVLGLKN